MYYICDTVMMPIKTKVMKVFLKELKKGSQFKFNYYTYTVKQRFSDWKKDGSPYLLTVCGEMFYNDELEIELIKL